MTRYVAFLRGVNVGGINIKMADLRTALTDMGLAEVKTILASGNALFDSERTDVDGLKADIEATLRKTFGYEAWIVLCTLDYVRAIVEAYPFDPEREGWHPYVLFTSDPSALTELLTHAPDLDPDAEQIAGGDGVLYWEVERGQTLQSTFGKAIGKRKFKATTTNRNLRTLTKLLS